MEMKKIPVKKPEQVECCGPRGERPLYPPKFFVDGKQMPEVKEWEVGNKYMMTIEVEMTDKSERDDGLEAGFQVVAYVPPKKMDEMTADEFGEYTGKVLSKN